MKSLLPAVFSACTFCLPLFPFAQTPDTYLINACAKMWSSDTPLDMELQITLEYPEPVPDESFTGFTDTDHACTEVNVLVQHPDLLEGFWVSGELLDTTNDYLSGLTINDLICIQKHILGLEPLGIFAQMAADANSSNSVTSFDLVELKKLLVGIYTELPNAPSWKVWSPNCTLPNPANPFQGGCAPFPPDSLAYFEEHPVTVTAIKTGDANGDYPNAQAPGLPSRSLYIPEISMSAGTVVDVPIYRKDFFDAEGFQFALRFDTSVLELKNIIDPSGSSAGNWAIFSSEGLLKHLSVYYLTPIPDTLSVLQFFVKNDAPLSGVIRLDTTALQPLYAIGCAERGKIRVEFDQTTATATIDPAIRITPASPNPFSENTAVVVELERPTPVKLDLTDLSGRLLYTTEQELLPGVHRLDIPAAAVQPGTSAVYRLVAGGRIFSGRVVRM